MHNGYGYIEGSKTSNDAAVRNTASYQLTLRGELSLKREIVLDFTCLKACLDPQKEKSDGEEVIRRNAIFNCACAMCFTHSVNCSLIMKSF